MDVGYEDRETRKIEEGWDQEVVTHETIRGDTVEC